MAISGVTEEKAIRLGGVGCKEEPTDSDSREVVGLLQGGWSGLFAFGPTIAHE